MWLVQTRKERLPWTFGLFPVPHSHRTLLLNNYRTDTYSYKPLSSADILPLLIQ